MNTFDQFGEAMLLAQQGRQEILRALTANVGTRLKAWLVRTISKVPPTDAHPH